MRRDTGLFPQPVRTAQIETTGTFDYQLRALRGQQPEVGARSRGPRRQVHQRRIGNIAISKDHHVDMLVADDLFHLVFFQDRNSVGIKVASQFGGITASGNVGDLRGSEGNYVKLRIIAKHYVEVVKISSSRTEDEDSLHSALKASLDP